MKVFFADTWFYIALLVPEDEHHAAAAAFAKDFDGFIVTTRWVLAELGNALSDLKFRSIVVGVLCEMEDDPSLKIVGDSDSLYRRGLALFGERPDKEWSLTDCISFVVMKDEELTEALTRDHHFMQAGFVPLFG